MTAHHVPANLRQFALAVGIALGLSAAAGASVITEAPQVSASAKFVDHGGRVLSAAQVYPIYWGRYWAPGRSASPTSEEITRALRTVLAGSYQAELAQYRTVGAATIRGSRVITTSDPPSGFTDKDIQAFLDVQFDSGVFPAPDDRAIYVVTIPPGIYSSEYSSETDIVGEHSFYRRDGHRVHFAWITNSVVLDGATQTTTHEIVESLTDPEGTAILGIPGTCDEDGWCEIADICADPGKLHGIVVAPYWSNIAGRCVIPAPPAYATSDRRLSAFAVSQARPAAVLLDVAVARLGTADERRDRATKRRSRKRGRRMTASIAAGRHSRWLGRSRWWAREFLRQPVARAESTPALLYTTQAGRRQHLRSHHEQHSAHSRRYPSHADEQGSTQASQVGIPCDGRPGRRRHRRAHRVGAGRQHSHPRPLADSSGRACDGSGIHPVLPEQLGPVHGPTPAQPIERIAGWTDAAGIAVLG